MESRLFSRFEAKDKDNEQFARDLQLLLGLSERQRASVIAALPELTRAKTRAAEKRATEALEAETGLPLVTIGHAVDLVRFLARKMLDEETKKDTVQAWATDLESLKLLDSHQAETLQTFLGKLKNEVLPELDAIRKETAYGAGVLPSLKGAGTTVELRGVFEDTFRWGTSVEDYVPKLREFIPIVSVHLSLDAGTPNEIWFQATPDEIGLLIDELRSAIKGAEVAHSSRPRVG